MAPPTLQVIRHIKFCIDCAVAIYSLPNWKRVIMDGYQVPNT